MRHGLMHVTWRVRTASGEFSLQALHPSLAGRETIDDHAAVTAHLAARSFPAPRLVPAPDGGPALRLDGAVWRCTTWIEGRPGARLAAPDEACRAARLLGEFHRATADLARPFRGGVRLHDPPAHAARLRDALRRASGDPALSRWRVAVAGPSDRALAALERLALPAGLPERVIHGDPKFSNFVFDGDGRAVGLVDLDGCARAPVLYDLGDAVRSWADAGPQAGPARFARTWSWRWSRAGRRQAWGCRRPSGRHCRAPGRSSPGSWPPGSCATRSRTSTSPGTRGAGRAAATRTWRAPPRRSSSPRSSRPPSRACGSDSNGSGSGVRGRAGRAPGSRRTSRVLAPLAARAGGRAGRACGARAQRG
ncbi:MAG: phosphotransferase, partial [Myxococcales bacterium]|nr:phosphotransferase [Myxococcales bacterium]